MNYYPIALFVYDRVDTVQKVIDSLRANPEAQFSEIYIFSDGSKGRNHNDVKSVREYICDIEGFKSLSIISSEANKGLEKSIVSGVTMLLEEYEAVIVLEDDIVVSPFFLKYMNDALTFYNKDPDVMHVSAYIDPIYTGDLCDDTFFYPTTSCWGWGTWRDAWSFYCSDPELLYSSLVKKNKLEEFDLHGTDVFRSQLLDNVYGIKNTWAIKWMASVFLNGGYCLHPKFSLTKNIGIGVNSTNTKKMNSFYLNQNFYQKPIMVKAIHKENSPLILARMRRFYKFNGEKGGLHLCYIFLGKFIKKTIRDLRRRFYVS